MELLTDDLPDAPPAPGPVPDGFDLTSLRDTALLYVHEAMAALTDDARLVLARLQAPAPPLETAQITACSPHGYLVTLTTQKATPALLIDAITKMQEWLQQAGYTSPKP